MKVRWLSVLAGGLWAGVALSAATPVNALVRTQQWGDYAGVASTHQADSQQICSIDWNYTQSIKIMNSSCSQSVCPGTDRNPRVQFLYAAGRHTTYFSNSCDGDFHVYGLSSCSC